MKRKYNTPTAEKMEFDYTESVEACSPGKQILSYIPGPYCTCTGGGQNNGGQNNGGQNNGGSNDYYAPGWGLNC